MEATGLQQAAIATFRHYYSELLSGNTGSIAEATIEPAHGVPDLTAMADMREAGRQAMDKTVMLKLNGGLGTSMGLERAKSLLKVKGEYNFLDIIAKQVLTTRQQLQCRLPLLLMNSFSTHADSLAALSRYHELPSDLPLDFVQNKVPKILQEDFAPAEWPNDPDLEWCPPGHGDLYPALVTSGILDHLVEHGYEYLFVSNADNLGAVLDLQILGYVASHRIPFLMEVTDRTEADKKGGHLARRRSDGQYILRESAQCPDDDLEAFQNIEVHRYFNTNNIWLQVSALRELLAQNDNVLPLPLIRNSKTLDPKNTSSPKVYQLETAMGAAIAIFPHAQALRVPRERFAPVKLCSDLLVLWSDVYELTEDWRMAVSPLRTLGPIAVDLDPTYFKLIDDLQARVPEGVPSLLRCSQLKVRGDVRFERDVTISGDAEIINPSGEQLVVAAGTVI
ncbi:UTP--glucose-1-phosphate uridylyltransferase [Candidatus Gracilibacteria bacterium]|nr:UTP--glucose-1-phosphate uridylyltransferase [Candidatus Gracilibacteria bacterium]